MRLDAQSQCIVAVRKIKFVLDTQQLPIHINLVSVKSHIAPFFFE